jgi:hypothetical protein
MCVSDNIFHKYACLYVFLFAFQIKIYGIPESCCPSFPHDLVQILMLLTSIYIYHIN